MNYFNNCGFELPISSLNKYVKKLSVSNSKKDLLNICSEITDDFEVSYFTCGLMCSDGFHHIKYLTLSNCERAWVSEYTKSNYQIIDPRIKEYTSTRLPVSWDINDRYLNDLAQEPKKMMLNAYDHNIRSGLTIPFYSPLSISGAFTLGINTRLYKGALSVKHLQSIAPYISYLGSYINQAIMQVVEPERLHKKNTLTPREKDCLRWLADGKTASQTASRLFISESTVKFHCKNSMSKLGARNTSHAISIAILNGYIRPVLGRE